MSGVKKFRERRKEDWESLDVNADNRLPASHRLFFLIDALMLSAIPVYIFSQIFDLPIDDNAVVFGGAAVVSAVILTMACQVRSKGLVARLINKRGIELQSSLLLKANKDGMDDKAKAKVKDAEKKRNEIDNEALALSLASTNALFLFFLVALTFFVLRNTQPTYNFVGSTLSSCVLTFWLASRSK